MHVEPAGEPHHVAEEGAFSAALTSEAVLQFFPVQDKVEPIRLVMAFNNTTWYEPPVEPIFEICRRQLDGYPFRQLPRFIGEQNLQDKRADVDIVQSKAILRYLGRKFGMYGKTLSDAARIDAIDAIIDGVDDVHRKLEEVWAVRKLENTAAREYEGTVLATEEELLNSDMQGPGLASFEVLLGPSPWGVTGPDHPAWLVTPAISIADVALFHLVDLHMRAFPEGMKRFPKLLAHHDGVAHQPGIVEYLRSANRHQMVWATEWIEQYQRKKAQRGGPPELQTPWQPAVERRTE